MIDQHGSAYVGALGSTASVRLQQGVCSLAEFATTLKAQHRAALAAHQPPCFVPVTISTAAGSRTFYVYRHVHNLLSFGRQLLLVSFTDPDLQDDPHFYISNRHRWQTHTLLTICLHRWRVEVYHEEAKALGLDQYQLRDFTAIQHHIALVVVAYSLLRLAQHDPDLHQQLQRLVPLSEHPTLPALCRAAQAQALSSIVLFVLSGLAHHHSLPSLLDPILRAISF